MKQTVSLNPGESKAVAFTFTPTVAKNYTVNVDGLTGSFSAIALPAEFVVSDLVISPAIVYVGDPVSISLVVTNVGGVSGSYEVNLEVF